MEAKQKGGAAFPFQGREDRLGMRPLPPSAGMSLRDYFAAKALQGAIAGALADGSAMDQDSGELLAAVAYKLADAMLAERIK